MFDLSSASLHRLSRKEAIDWQSSVIIQLPNEIGCTIVTDWFEVLHKSVYNMSCLQLCQLACSSSNVSVQAISCAEYSAVLLSHFSMSVVTCRFCNLKQLLSIIMQSLCSSMDTKDVCEAPNSAHPVVFQIHFVKKAIFDKYLTVYWKWY